jgi:hypothetical protein
MQSSSWDIDNSNDVNSVDLETVDNISQVNGEPAGVPLTNRDLDREQRDDPDQEHESEEEETTEEDAARFYKQAWAEPKLPLLSRMRAWFYRFLWVMFSLFLRQADWSTDVKSVRMAIPTPEPNSGLNPIPYALAKPAALR